MTNPVIQNKIDLIGFRVVECSLNTMKKHSKRKPKPKFDIGMSDLTVEDDATIFIKSFEIHIIQNVEEIGEIFDLKAEYHAAFKLDREVNQDFLDSVFARISAPAIGFPYLRAFVTTVSTQAGFPPVILPSINFVEFSKRVI